MRVHRRFGIAVSTVLALGSAVLPVWGQPATGSGGAPVKKSFAELTESAVSLPGFVDLYWRRAEGKLYLATDRFEQEMLYVESLAAGVGSNDIGLDRGQMGDSHLVVLRRIGPKVLLVEKNLRYRAESDNPDERLAVEEAFAESTLWGFRVAAEQDGVVLLDATDFVLSDAHKVARRLAQRNQGKYKLDSSRSAVFMPRTKAFPRNTEIEATLTFTGDPKGAWIRSVTPSPDAVTVRQHLSFIALPEDGYQPRRWDPRSGFIAQRFYDYATPISKPLVQRYVVRHRLEKQDPTATISDPVEPIVYYLDRGAPEPIRSALLEGARWWNQAFEAAGYRDAFRVDVLPEGADPLDVRYNVIQWVHRSTRGWSYGGSVEDPRTGEILKGVVILGSLRVRQDYLIAQGLLSGYGDDGSEPPALIEMALARLRQLAAHEVGHTLGLVHNYAASVNDRASVMDYPHPLVRLDADGEIDLSAAYDTGIGEWDERAITFGYQDFPDGADEAAELDRILAETRRQGLLFLTDQDARPPGSAHPLAHLWDNGTSAAAELERILEVRGVALNRLSERTVPVGAPLASIEDALVPVYLLHRYQTEAAAKVVGGLEYSYAMRGDGQTPVGPLPPAMQEQALTALLETIGPDALTLPAPLLELIPPRPPNTPRGRENFASRAGVAFDPLAAAEVAADMTLGLLLHPERASRLVDHHARDAAQPALEAVIHRVLQHTLAAPTPEGLAAEVKRVVDRSVVRHLIGLAASSSALPQASSVALYTVREVAARLRAEPGEGTAEQAHRLGMLRELELYLEHPEVEPETQPIVRTPDGAPIGSLSGELGLGSFEPWDR